MSRGRCPSSRILIGALAPNHDTSRHCWRVDAGQRALGSGSARRLVTTRFDRAMRSALEPTLHEDLGAAASTTLERSADTRGHTERSQCATGVAAAPRTRAADAPAARACAPAARPRAARAGACTAQTRHVQVRFWWWVVGDNSAKFSRQLPRIWGSIPKLSEVRLQSSLASSPFPLPVTFSFLYALHAHVHVDYRY